MLKSQATSYIKMKETRQVQSFPLGNYPLVPYHYDGKYLLSIGNNDKSEDGKMAITPLPPNSCLLMGAENINVRLN